MPGQKCLCGSCGIQYLVPRDPGGVFPTMHLLLGIEIPILAVDRAVAYELPSAPLGSGPVALGKHL